MLYYIIHYIILTHFLEPISISYLTNREKEEKYYLYTDYLDKQTTECKIFIIFCNLIFCTKTRSIS